MQIDFHYYATYCAAFLTGYSHEESLDIATASMYTDCCTRTALKRMKAPLSAATTQTQTELIDASPDILGLQDITRIWSSFHFLPADLNANPGRRPKRYLNRYRLLCGPNGDLLIETLRLARQEGSLQAVGLAMHVLADTWAHSYFVGTPSAVMNNVSDDFYEIITVDGKETERKVGFHHKVSGGDDLENGKYTSSILQYNEHSVMTLGHGRVGHLPDYSFMKYRYIPSWGDYEQIVKDNPSDYMHAFAQMIYAMKAIRAGETEFSKERYDFEAVEPCRERIEQILRVRRVNASEDWKAFGESLSGRVIPEFSPADFEQEYIDASGPEKDLTKPGKYIIAALAQKSMVTKHIYESGNMTAGYSVDFSLSGLKGMKDFHKLAGHLKGGDAE